MKPSLRCKGPFKIKTWRSVILQLQKLPGSIIPNQKAPGWILRVELQLFKRCYQKEIMYWRVSSKIQLSLCPQPNIPFKWSCHKLIFALNQPALGSCCSPLQRHLQSVADLMLLNSRKTVRIHYDIPPFMVLDSRQQRGTVVHSNILTHTDTPIQCCRRLVGDKYQDNYTGKACWTIMTEPSQDQSFEYF